MATKKEETFEEALEKLKETVELLDGGNCPLDKSLEYFEEGVRLIKLCNEKLDKAEQKVKVLSVDSNGEISEKDFVGEGK